MSSNVNHLHNRIVPPRLIVAGVLLVSAFATVVGAQTTEEEESIPSWTSETGQIPVRESDRLLVTGIDLNALMGPYMQDHDEHEYRRWGMGPDPSGAAWNWRVKRDAEKSSRIEGDTSGDRRRWYMRLQIGVFGSHREALLGAHFHYTHMQAVCYTHPIDPEERGYVSWHRHNRSVRDGFVRDNVFVQVATSENADEIMDGLDRDIKNGAEGISKGPVVQKPVILGEGFPNQLTARTDGKLSAPLPVADPRDRPVYVTVAVTDSDIVSSEIGSMAPAVIPPDVRWEEPGVVVVHNPGSAKVVDLLATAMNDLCVVSTWEKKGVRIVPPEEGDGN